MFNVDFDFSGITEYLDEVQRALRAVDGNLGQVKIDNVTDPQDVQRALAQVEEIVDRAFAPYISNPTVRALAAQMKAGYKDQMLRQIETKRREISRSQLSNEG
jgi:hypothetical protein